jgi:hypothetical protein
MDTNSPEIKQDWVKDPAEADQRKVTLCTKIIKLFNRLEDFLLGYG